MDSDLNQRLMNMRPCETATRMQADAATPMPTPLHERAVRTASDQPTTPTAGADRTPAPTDGRGTRTRGGPPTPPDGRTTHTRETTRHAPATPRLADTHPASRRRNRIRDFSNQGILMPPTPVDRTETSPHLCHATPVAQRRDPTQPLNADDETASDDRAAGMTPTPTPRRHRPAGTASANQTATTVAGHATLDGGSHMHDATRSGEQLPATRTGTAPPHTQDAPPPRRGVDDDGMTRRRARLRDFINHGIPKHPVPPTREAHRSEPPHRTTATATRPQPTDDSPTRQPTRARDDTADLRPRPPPHQGHTPQPNAYGRDRRHWTRQRDGVWGREQGRATHSGRAGGRQRGEGPRIDAKVPSALAAEGKELGRRHARRGARARQHAQPAHGVHPAGHPHLSLASPESDSAHATSQEVVDVTLLPKTPGSRTCRHLRPITALPADAKKQSKAMLGLTEPHDASTVQKAERMRR